MMGPLCQAPFGIPSRHTKGADGNGNNFQLKTLTASHKNVKNSKNNEKEN